MFSKNPFASIAKSVSYARKTCAETSIRYNRQLDSFVREGLPDYMVWAFMKRDKKNRWSECGVSDTAGAEYGKPFPYANFLAMGRARV